MKWLKGIQKAMGALILPELCRCAVCGEEREMVEQTGFCRQCWEALPHNPEPVGMKASLITVSPFLYEGEIETLIKGLKFHNKRYAAEALGHVMAQACLQAGIGADLLVPVPLYKTRYKNRGYNQSAFLAQSMAELMNVPVREECLLRVRNTEQQAMLDALQRRANVYGAFEAPMDLTEKTVCLVDDVATTGSTLRACADALEAKGAAVWVCTACSA